MLTHRYPAVLAAAAAAALATSVVAPAAFGVITVSSAISDTGDSVRAQAVITNPTGVDGEAGGTITAVAIKEIHAAIFVIDSEVPDFRRGSSGGQIGGNPLSVTKRQWSAQGAYGLGLPFGYVQPPTTDPEGPWFGLSWPYRDQYDYFPDFGDPLADDVGTAFTIEPNVYGFLDVDGIARGGPTDPTPAGGDPNLLLRGLTGNGLSGPATYFGFELDPVFGDPNRFVTIQILSTTARVVVQDQAGAYSEIVVQVPPFQTTIQLPEPAAAAGVALPLWWLARRRPR